MAGVRKAPTKGGKYQGWFLDAAGRQCFFTAKNKAEARRIGEKLEAEHHQVRLGYRPAPSSADKHRKHPFAEMMQEYLAWGVAQGGRGGRPWGAVHARNRRTHLGWWMKGLGLKTLADLEGILPRVEAALRELQTLGRAGKTIANHSEALHAFCLWAEQRGYVAADPLKGLAPFDSTPQTYRRAMTAEEISRLLQVCVLHRRLLLEMAFMSGLRANELRNLRVKHLDLEKGGVHLEAEWTKNRKPGFQPLPHALAERLKEFAESGEPARLYARFHVRKNAGKSPKDPLLYVPSHTARALDEALKAAGIPKQAPGGKLDFHACRLAYINFVIESGATVKEAQALARHSTPDLTMNVYGRTRPERLAETVEKMAGNISLPDGKNVPSMYKQAVGAETKSATSEETGSCAQEKWWRRRDSNPRPKTVPLDHYVRSQLFNLARCSSN